LRQLAGCGHRRGANASGTLVTTRKPPWDCTDEQRWLKWIEEQFDFLDAQAGVTEDERAFYASVRVLNALPPAAQSELFRKWKETDARGRLRYGDAALLRKLHPDLAETFAPPPRWRQRRLQRDRRDKRLLLKHAIEDVHRIRQLWRDHYDGRWKRPRMAPSAVRLAALRNDIDENELEDAIRRGGLSYLELSGKNHPK
jgi:hypothetical protein